MFYTKIIKSKVKSAFSMFQDVNRVSWLVDQRFYMSQDREQDPVVLFFPTMSSRVENESFFSLLRAVYQDVLLLEKSGGQYVILVGVQSLGEVGPSVKSMADRLAALFGSRLTVFYMRGHGKLRSINEAIKFSSEIGARAIGIFDDDLVLEPGCIPALVARFAEQDGKGIVGLEVDLIEGMARRKSLYVWLRAHARVTVDYPGAAYMVDPKCYPDGLPAACQSDDGYFFFRNLMPTKQDPFERINMVRSVRAVHYEQPNVDRYHRLRRSMLSTHYLLAHFDEQVSTLYRKLVVFDGFWPLGKLDYSKGLVFAFGKWFSKSVIAAIYFAVGVELVFRGVLGKPIREIRWEKAYDGKK